MDLWLLYLPESGWATVDGAGAVNGRPWEVPLADQTSEPPFCTWVSRKGERSYVYELVKLAGSSG